MEQEVEESFRAEDHGKDRFHAVANPGSCKRASISGQERPAICTKHKTSNPLSCPGSVTTGYLDHQQERVTTTESATGSIEIKSKSLQGSAVGSPKKQGLAKIDIRGERTQLANHVPFQSQHGVLLPQETGRNESGRNARSQTCANRRDILRITQQQNAADVSGPISLGPGVTKSTHLFPVQTKRKGISPVRDSFERAELNTTSNEGGVLKQQRLKSPNKCWTLKQNVGSDKKTAKRQYNVSDDDDIARRWSTREKGIVNENRTNASPSKIRHRMLLIQEAAEVEKQMEVYNEGIAFRCRRARQHSSTQDVNEHLETKRSCQRHDSPTVTRPPFISSGTLGYKKLVTGPMMQARPCKPTGIESESKGGTDKDKDPLIQSVRESFKAQLPNVRRGSELDSEQKIMEANAHVSPLRERHRLLSDASTKGVSRIINNCLQTTRCSACTLSPRTGTPIPQEQRKILKHFGRSQKLAAHEDQMNEEHGLWKDSASRGVGRDPGSPKSRRKDIRYETATWRCVADDHIIRGTGKPREENSRKGEGSEPQEKHVQGAKPRNKAVWKSYIDEKKQNVQAIRKKLEAPRGRTSIKSEPSSPPASTDRKANSRAKRPTELHTDHQSKDSPEQPVLRNTPRNCCTSAAGAKNHPDQSARNLRDNSVPRSWKFSQLDSNGNEKDASEKIGTKIRLQSAQRFQSPVNQVRQVFRSTRVNTEELKSKEKNCWTNEFLTMKEKLRRSGESTSSFDVVALRPMGNLGEKERSVSKDAGSKSARNVGDTLMTAGKSGTFSRDHVKVMKRATELIKESSSSGLSKVYSNRDLIKPWQSRTPFRRSPNRNKNDDFQDDHVHKQRIDLARFRASHKSRMICSGNKPCLSHPPSISPDRIVDEQDYHEPSHRSSSSDLKTSKNCPEARSKRATKLSECSNRTIRSPRSSEVSKSSLLISSDENKDSTNDTSGRQSLDYVLGSLAEQVRELDERLRGATISSPASSSSSIITSRGLYLNGDNQSNNQPCLRPLDELSKDRSSPFSSVASSPERHSQKISHGSPAGNISRVYSNGNTRHQQVDSAFRHTERPASARTYMDELKKLLREISSESNQIPLRKLELAAVSSMITRNAEREIELHNVQDIVKTSSDDQLDHKAMHYRCYGNGNSRTQDGRERVAYPVSEIDYKVKDSSKTNKYEKRNLRQENGFIAHDKVKRVLEKRLPQNKWVQQQSAENVRKGTQERFQRTAETMDCAPNQVLDDGHAVLREHLVKGGVKNRLHSPEINGNGIVRKGVVIPEREWKTCNYEIGNETPFRQREDGQEFPAQQIHSNGELDRNGIAHNEADQPWMLQQVVENCKPAVNKVSGEVVRPGGPRSNGHINSMGNSMRRRPVHQVKDQTRYSEHLNERERLRYRKPGSPHFYKSWTKGDLDLDAVEDQVPISQSVDFSIRNNERLSCIETSHVAVKDRNGSKSSTRIAEDLSSNGSLVSKNQRSKSVPKLRKSFDQKPVREDAVPNGNYSFNTNSGSVQGLVSAPNLGTLKSQALENLRKSKPVVRGVDVRRSSSDHPNAAQIGSLSPKRRDYPGGKISPERNKRRTTSIPKSRQVTEQWSSQAEMSESTSKTTQDNYLPVVMAKDPESRLKVIQRRKKALQLDLEHRQRMRNSRPASSQSTL
ncbi:uncharacterized protein [Physcomitrium patens]